jgi:hypothetical protein
MSLDKDIIDSQSNLKKTEGKMSHKLNIDDTAVQTEAQISSDPICSSAGCTQYKHPKKKDPYPKDYFVPNFGTDRDIKDNFDDLKVAEGIVGHNWKFIFEEPPVNPAKKTLYDDKPELDADIVDSVSNLKKTELKLQHPLELDNVQLSSDPICSSAGC